MYGATIGDINGSIYEFNNYRKEDFKLFQPEMFYTDDTVLTAAVAYCLINDKDPKEVFPVFVKKFPNRGYGGSFYRWAAISKNKEPYNSYGNGAAMRISPVGWYAKSEEEVKELAYKFTAVTHNHPEGLKAAEVVAMCIFKALRGASKKEIKEYVSKYYDINFSLQDLRKNYFFNETSQNTVPQAIYCFLISKDFEDCLRKSISIGGDSDTLAAISCSIAEAYYGIPEKFIEKINNYVSDRSEKQLILYSFRRIYEIAANNISQ